MAQSYTEVHHSRALHQYRITTLSPRPEPSLVARASIELNDIGAHL